MEISLIRSSFVGIIQELLKGMFEGERLIDPDAVSSREFRPAVGAAVGEDGGDDVGGERVELVDGREVEEREDLVLGCAGGSSCDYTEDDVDRRRREDDVGVLRDGGDHVLGEAQRDLVLHRD